MKSRFRNLKRRSRRHSALLLSIASAFSSPLLPFLAAQTPQKIAPSVRRYPQAPEQFAPEEPANSPAATTIPAPLPQQSHTDTAARPASVTLADGMLTVQADNSNLSQILRDVSRESGMVIDGDIKETRVYGNYGPKDPSTILSELLEGMGYNIMIIGGADGETPKRMMLSSRTGGPSLPASFASATDPLPAPVQQAVQQIQPAADPTPGALAHPHPPPSDDPQVRAQQNLQRLQQMHSSLMKDGTP